MQIIVFLLVFGVIVTIHEFGHFYFAKRSGILVREFAIGMGPKIFATKKNGTTYTIRALPVGGYVRLAGYGDDVEPLKAGQLISIVLNQDNIVTCINTCAKTRLDKAVPFEVRQADLEKEMLLIGRLAGQDTDSTFSVSKEATYIEENGTEIQVAPLEKQFEQASIFRRILVNFGGPLNNFILGILLFILVGFMNGGIPHLLNKVNVMENTPAYQAGIRTGDSITQVDHQETKNGAELYQRLSEAKKTQTQVELIVEKENHEMVTYTVPFQNNVIGVTFQQEKDASVTSILAYGFTRTWEIATGIWSTLAGFFKTGFDIQQFGGPVAIAQASGQATQGGIMSVLMFMAAISVNLGVMNLLPIPALDGGKIVLNILELLRGKPISKEKETMITLVFAGLLVLLMVAVTFNDIQRWFFK
ncbi:RIP metalloprotease RseP [Carnobacteriaceae bacterium zg-ZUI78]|uniref:RIP metalloprotease RseP n=1 Tax=Granulicatella sp. zg-84 TaxID=2678503 RepID=UPI0013C0455A|nr:RIP metalloprotease RseP [Granulicatella sp. zg-84]MBS4750892.1 RIP metalloprotease RseP [Carnobacteriaceae bacterium zg-ZUI78]NEW65541.1 RIP metalloprotease RseP [Granulicatella sp. zg-84]QMI85576.1 RIP metalloprotease RseP [Carnobacteriaceae bacterium zg-84]